MTMPIARRHSRTIRAGCAGSPHPACDWTQPAPGPIHPIGTLPRLDRTAVPSRRPQPRAMASDSRRRAIADSARCDVDHRLLLVQHRRVGPRPVPSTQAARAWFQPHWVGDLTLSLRLTVREPAGQFRLELIKAGVSNRCEIDLASGEAQLFHGDVALGRRRVRRESRGPGRTIWLSPTSMAA